MNANRQFDEDDLVLYAMRLLAEPQHAEVAAFIETDQNARARLAEIQSTLAAYAEAAVEPQALPAGSLDRLLARLETEPKPLHTSSIPEGSLGEEDRLAAAGLAGVAGQASLTGPALVPRAPQTAGSDTRSGDTRRLASNANSAKLAPPSSFGWAAAIGWAVAALLALTAGLTLKQRSSLRETVSARDTQLAALSSDATSLRRERDTLRANLSGQEQRLANSSSELAATQSQAAALKNEADSARSAAANLSGQTSQLSAKLNAEQARAAAAEQERNRLQGTLAAQADQLAALQTATSNAEVLATLTDPSALRVVLTKPKSKPAPVGRAAYIASKGSLVFLANNLDQLKANKVYELWILPADGSSPVPAGTFLPDAKGNAHVVYARFPRPVAAKGFAMTIENTGGATTPTLPLILAGS